MWMNNYGTKTLDAKSPQTCWTIERTKFDKRQKKLSGKLFSEILYKWSYKSASDERYWKRAVQQLNIDY